SNFTAYSRGIFDDTEQLRLSTFFTTLHQKGGKLLLSNSDPKNANQQDDFFEQAYQGYHIHRIKAGRSINSNAAKRGLINEVLITNYAVNLS
ncbi:MAG: DNA adenine methylase, partial [Kamptonema sp. SIO4C4]|nr:DNA adenine methylase [Kamptonema sp. SIO4C4]